MTRKRNIGGLAAIGGVTAAIVLLTGLPTAKADELADLRANQLLLEQRINQLAQAQQQAQLPDVSTPSGTPSTLYGAGAPPPGTGTTAGSFPRSFLIPGTDTSIRVGGFVDETLDYYLQGGPPNGTQSTTIQATGQLEGAPLKVTNQTVPGLPIAASATHAANAVPVQVANSRGNSIFLQTPRESRLNVETRTPTAWGESRTFIEFDFAGGNNFSTNNATQVSDSLIPRLRYAYGTLGGVLAGQANSNFSDPDANPETLDFGGPTGEAGVVRIPQVRYTYAGPYGSAFSVSAETPHTELLTPAGLVETDTNLSQNPVSNTLSGATTSGCVANGGIVPGSVTTGTTSTCSLGSNITKSPAPDLTFAAYFAQPWGHVDFRAAVRDLEVNDGKFVSEQYIGYGGGVSGDVKPGWFGWAKDDFLWQVTVGNGLGHYLNSSTNAALATNYIVTPACATPMAGCSLAATGIIVQPIFEIGGTVGYQHFWLPNLRSTLAYGYSKYNISSQLVGPLESTVANKQLQTVHINLIFSPVAFIDTGVEYTWGQRQVVAGLYGQVQALIGKIRVKF
jgi:Porin subfamily/DcaP outer membrane protein